MGREDFRRDLRNTFESISGPSSPALSSRVHDALLDHTAPRRNVAWMPALAALVLAVLIVGALYVAGPLGRHVPGPVIPASSPSASPSSSPVASPSPSLSPSPSPTATGPAFVCSIQPINSSGAPATAFVDAVRVGTHQGYDRITIEFQNGLPASIEARPQSNATFTQGASGQTVVLAGSKGLMIIIHGADEHTAYSGPTDFKTGYSGLQEARQVEDFEGVVQWALGTSSTGCYRMFVLTNPARLVIDVQTS